MEEKMENTKQITLIDRGGSDYFTDYPQFDDDNNRSFIMPDTMKAIIDVDLVAKIKKLQQIISDENLIAIRIVGFLDIVEVEIEGKTITPNEDGDFVTAHHLFNDSCNSVILIYSYAVYYRYETDGADFYEYEIEGI